MYVFGVRPDHLFRDLLDCAQAQGITDPVFAFLSAVAPQARAVYAAIHGTAMDRPPGPHGEELAAPEILSAPAAGQLLREHCGPGGAGLADVITDPAYRPEFWLACVARDGLHAGPVVGGEAQGGYHTAYDAMPTFARPTHLATGACASPVLPVGAGGGSAAVSEPCSWIAGSGAARASTLRIRRVQVTRHGRLVWVRLTDDTLAEVLARNFCDPKIIAAAIRSLRKVGGHGERQLMRVLWGYPRLRELARLVRAELRGEAPK